ncbi:MAG TPA: glycogen synthase GlgA [Gammaproteobacteria bacterium]
MLKILFASSEVQPLMKTGGLADVSGALPAALNKLRHDVRIIMPAYGDIFKKAKRAQHAATLGLPGIAGEITILKKKLPDTRVEVYLVDYPPAFQRSGNPYVNAEGDPWRDNAERFALFCRSVCEVAQDRAGLNWQPDIVHCNDWQTGLAPALLQAEAARPAMVFTIHNLAYQGLFPQETFALLGLPDPLWSPQALEFHQQLSFIKGGIVFADRVNTVSPRYATEIQTAEFGNGLEGLLKHRGNKLSGILNGIDDKEWNPANDLHLKSTYDVETLAQKKPNKAFLQTSFDLPNNPDVLMLGFIGRLVDQKGVDLIIKLIPQLDHLPVQLIVLGNGDHKLERALKELATRHSRTVKCHIGYSETLSHQIEAGCDVFLMPSRFEPCGLNQLYSLRYGTIPIVTNVGGLADSVTDLDDEHSNLDAATGFIMKQTSAAALYTQIVKAINVYQDQDQWTRLIKNGMGRNFSWVHSANAYISLYETALRDRSAGKAV